MHNLKRTIGKCPALTVETHHTAQTKWNNGYRKQQMHCMCVYTNARQEEKKYPRPDSVFIFFFFLSFTGVVYTQSDKVGIFNVVYVNAFAARIYTHISVKHTHTLRTVQPNNKKKREKKYII